MVEKSQDKEMDKSVAVGNVENNSENDFSWWKSLFLFKKFNFMDLYKAKVKFLAMYKYFVPKSTVFGGDNIHIVQAESTA